ncbi:hypothetical protein CC2G_004086 [Coprinopsis cinerea AmutBmut pab1-1]|nr:hypothetical protein CC2G_004086 [Coprinopsis cinerea AmutBmut pab1-1]
MAPSQDPLQVMDGIFQTITSQSASPSNVVSHIKSITPKELRDAALASPLSSGQDPLSVVAGAGYGSASWTVGALYILVARLTVQNAQAPPLDVITDFCKHFDPVQARHVPDRVTALARAIQRLAVAANNPRWAIEPLYLLLTRYPPRLSSLTTIHPIFTLTCLQAKHPTAALPILEVPISNIDTNLSELTYNDNLTYHYTGGIIFAMLKRWKEAEEFFQIVVTAPSTYPSSLQMEALKKMSIGQLIWKGKVSPLPKYTHPLLVRQFKSTPYQAFINAYPHNSESLKELLNKEKNLFQGEKNMGLLRQAVDRAPRWVLKKLTATYLSLNLTEIAKAVKIEDVNEVRGILLSMIEDGDLSATLSSTETETTVTFSDPSPRYNKSQIDALLLNAQAQSEYLLGLDRELGKSKEYLSKAVKGKGGDDGFSVGGMGGAMGAGMGGWPGGVEEELFAAGGGSWEDGFA